MPAKLIDGKGIAAEIEKELKAEVEILSQEGIRPGLAALLVGDNPASKIYVRNKRKVCERVGIYSEEHLLPQSASQGEVLKLVETLNRDLRIDGILVQLPLPKQIDEREILEAVRPEKDVDGFKLTNVARLLIGSPRFVPCTPLGILTLLDRVGIDIEGKRAVVVGRSNIVGKPTAALLLHRNATVTICHSKTKNIGEVVSLADIVVAAIGRPQFITAQMIKPGAVVIDVGINRLSDGRIVGDVDFPEVGKRAGWITPVPGGVGPMTIVMLLSNTILSAKSRAKVGR